MTERSIKLSDDIARELQAGTRDSIRIKMDPQPAVSPSHDHFELIPDPWHNEALSGTPMEGKGNVGARKSIWYSFDWVGNPIGEYGVCPYGKVGDRLWSPNSWGAVVLEITDIRIAEMVDHFEDDGTMVTFHEWKIYVKAVQS